MWSSLKSWLFGESAPSVVPPAEDPRPALGWDAIDAAFRSHYGAGECGHWGHGGVMAMHDLQQPPAFPLDGISVWDGGDFWHFVGFGMSELYGKDSEVTEVSGWGYELSLRLAKQGDDPPPIWVADLLQALCRAQWSRPLFAPFQTIRTGALGPDTAIVGFALVEDPDLGTLDTPHGAMTVLLLVGLTEGELEAAVGGHAETVLQAKASWVTVV